MYYTQQPRGRPDKPFPVSDEFFPQPLVLTTQRLEELRADVAKELAKALRECANYQRSRGTYLVNSPPWSAHAALDGLSEYKAPHKTRPNTSVSRVFGTIDGNYRDIAKFYRSETREQYFNVQKTLFNYTVDAAVLHNVPQESPDAYEGIKWVAFEPFALRFRMDSCHFESSGTGVDANGKPYAFRVLVPAPCPEVPDLFKSKRTVRMVNKTVMLMLPSERNAQMTEVFMTLRNDFKSNSVPRSFYKRFLLSLRKIHEFVGPNAKPYKPYMLTNQLEWALEQPMNDCGVCSRPFSLLRSKRCCSMCGADVCRRCVVRSRDVLQVRPLSKEEVGSSRICTPCIQLMREDNDHRVSTPILGGPSNMGLDPRDIWAKSPTIHEPLRMSETPTDVTASLPSSHGLSTGSESSLGSSMDASSMLLTGNSRFSVSHRLSTSSSHSSTSHRHSMVSLTSPIAVVGAPNEEIEYIDEDDVIYEEDPEMLSQRRTTTHDEIITLDTSEMQRVRGDSNATHSSGLSIAHSRTASVSSTASEEVFQSISSSLLEQELLLRQLQAATRSVRGARRDTRSDSAVATDVAVR